MYIFISNLSYLPEFINGELLTHPISKTLTIGENLFSKSRETILQKSPDLSFYEGEKRKNFDLEIAEIANDRHRDFRGEDQQGVPNDVYETRLPQWRKALPNQLRAQRMKSFPSKLLGTACWLSDPMREGDDPREGRVRQPITLAFLGNEELLKASKIRKKACRNRVSKVVVEALREVQRANKKRSCNNNDPLKKDRIEPSTKPQKIGLPSPTLQDDQRSKNDLIKPPISLKEGTISRQKPLLSPSFKRSFVQDLARKSSSFSAEYQRKETQSGRKLVTKGSAGVPKTGAHQTESALQPKKPKKRQDLCTARTVVENQANVQNSTSKSRVLRAEKREKKCRYRSDDGNVEARSSPPTPMKRYYAQTPTEANRLPEAATRRSTVREWSGYSHSFGRQQKIGKSPQYPKKSKEQQAKCEMHGLPEWRPDFSPARVFRVTVVHDVFKEVLWRYHF